VVADQDTSRDGEENGRHDYAALAFEFETVLVFDRFGLVID
jgi:hypothetical protein